ncbi:LWamide neuropeptides-like isoform X2 [Bacillus rossius redtenbacheri]
MSAAWLALVALTAVRAWPRDSALQDLDVALGIGQPEDPPRAQLPYQRLQLSRDSAPGLWAPSPLAQASPLLSRDSAPGLWAPSLLAQASPLLSRDSAPGLWAPSLLAQASPLLSRDSAPGLWAPSLLAQASPLLSRDSAPGLWAPSLLASRDSAPEGAAPRRQVDVGVFAGQAGRYLGQQLDRRVGAFRLRSDRGYQVLMDVPAAASLQPADGVLVMEVKATVYRPVA